jgi:hypothetical protein
MDIFEMFHKNSIFLKRPIKSAKISKIKTVFCHFMNPRARRQPGKVDNPRNCENENHRTLLGIQG